MVAFTVGDPDRADQKMLRSRMQDALAQKDNSGCWGRIIFFNEVCHTATTYDSPDAVLARLISHRDGHYVFITHGSHYATGQRSIYHARHDEFKIAWLDHGPNSAGALVTGDELEATLWYE